jgi:hypothetical protein
MDSVYMLPNTFQLFSFPIFWPSVPDEGYSINAHCALSRVWRYQRGNQNSYIEEEQTTQWPKEKGQNDKQRFTKHTHQTKDLYTTFWLYYGFHGNIDTTATAVILNAVNYNETNFSSIIKLQLLINIVYILDHCGINWLNSDETIILRNTWTGNIGKIQWEHCLFYK